MVGEDISRSLGSIESKVDILLERSRDHTARLRGLEKSRNWFKGALAALTVAWGFVMKALLEHK